MRHFVRRPARPTAALALALVATLTAGCATGQPAPISNRELTAAQQFPYYLVYWAGLHFDRVSVTAADGEAGYNEMIGDSVDYGDCDPGHGPLHTGGCVLPLVVTTVIYRHHSNQSLGRQRNVLIRGVPAAIFNDGKSIEVYTGRVAVDVYADSAPRALKAAQALRPINAPGSPRDALPPPTYCPELVGPAPHYVVARQPNGRLDCVSTSNLLARGGS